jgi:hypothetical protein
MQTRITRRIEAECGVPDLLEALAERISASDLKSLLLAAYRRRVSALDAPGVLAREARNPLLAVSAVDLRVLNEFDRLAFGAASAFEAVDLSPATALGASSVLGGIDQNNVLTTIRNVEVSGDPTVALAIESARRRAHARGAAAVKLCSSQRVVRLQPLDFPGYTPHFRLFGLVSAGRDTGSHAFEIEHLTEHIRVYLDLFRALRKVGFRVTEPLVEVSDLNLTEQYLKQLGVLHEEVRAHVRAHVPGGSAKFLRDHAIDIPADLSSPLLRIVDERVFSPLKRDYPEAAFQFDATRLEGMGYYRDLCLRISPLAPDGQRYPIADGGFTDWTARLLQDRKERLLASGIGSEFTCRRYRASA